MMNGQGMYAPSPFITSFASLPNFVIDAADHKIAFKFYAESTSEITHVDARFTGVGNTSGCSFKFRIETDASDFPSGTVLGAATAAFAGPSSSQSFWAGGGTNPIALATSTGALTLNTPYWLVVYEDGTNPDSSNYIQAVRTYTYYSKDKVKLDDGTNAWTHATAVASMCSFILKKADGTYQGSPFLGTSTPSAVTNIYDNNKQATRFRFGSGIEIGGVWVSVSKTGSPTNLMVRLFEGSTQKELVEIPAAEVPSATAFAVFFSTSYLIPPATDIYVLLNQKGTDETDGGDSSNYYRHSIYTLHPTYYLSVWPECPRLFGGTNTNPTLLTESSSPETNIPTCKLMVLDCMNGFDCPTSSGSSPRFGDRTGGKN